MDLPCLKWQKHVEEKWTKLSRDEKTGWSRMADIDELFEFALSQINQEDLLFLSGISEDYPVQKDSAHASRCRERGNASFKARLYTAAALHYSQGVCHASRSSEQLSLCYANRSAALLHLQLYQESVEDVDRALQHGYPSPLQPKLLQRRALCLRLRPQAPDPPRPRPAGQSTGGRGTEEWGQPNQHVSPLCPGVSVRFSPGKGRHLVALEGKAAGDVVLQDRAYSCVLIPGMGGTTETERERGSERGQREFGTEERRCHRCLRETLSPVPCEGCSHARYCSEGCRGGAWTQYHRWECPIGAELRATGVMSQLALRVALKAGLKDVRRATQPIRDESSLSKPITKEEYPEDGVTASADRDGGGDPSACYHGDSYLSVYHLLPHLSSHAPSLRYLCAVTIATLYRKLTGAGPPPASWDVTGSAGSRKCPGQSQEPEDEGSAVGWAPELSLLGAVVLRHMLQLRCNAQAVSALTHTGERDAAVWSNEEVRIATAIFPTLSVLNHSCRPNTSLSFSPGASLEHGAGRDPGPPEPVCPAGVRSAGVRSPVCGVTVSVRAARAIAPGQEILHCYGPHSSRMGAGRRRALLQDQYFFLCECEACTARGSGVGGEGSDAGLLCGTCSEPLKGGEDAEGWCVCPCGQRLSHAELVCRLKEVRAQLEQAAQLTEREQPDQALRVLRRAGSQAALFLRETHPLQGELADAMARAHATMGDWQAAASQLDRSAMAVGFQYGEDSVELGRQLFKLAQLHFNGHAPGPALSALLRARKLLSLHCDARCPELQELQAMERCLREVL